MEDYIIDVNNVIVRFNKANMKVDNLKEYVVRLLRRELMFQEFIALKDVDLHIKKGEAWGLVGTNGAGKSTLLNTLTDAGVLSEDKLFATLDPTTRLLELDGGQRIYLTDTVGFIRKLPHHLIEAFKSTLEEAKYADVILHVVDASNPQVEEQMFIVYETLRELGVKDKTIVTLFNKQDRLAGNEILRDFKADYVLKISARTGLGLDELKNTLEKILIGNQIYIERVLDYKDAGMLQLVRKYGQLIEEKYTENGIEIKARVPKDIYGRLGE